MADKSIESLDSLSRENLDNSEDLLPIFDTSEGKTKHILVDDIIPDVFNINSEIRDTLTIGGKPYDIADAFKDLEPGVLITAVSAGIIGGTAWTIMGSSLHQNGQQTELWLQISEDLEPIYGIAQLVRLTNTGGLSIPTNGIWEATYNGEIENTYNVLQIIFSSIITGTFTYQAGSLNEVTSLICQTASPHGLVINQSIGIRECIGLEYLLNGLHTVSAVDGPNVFSFSDFTPVMQGTNIANYTPNSGSWYIPGATTNLVIQTVEQHNLLENDLIYIPYDNYLTGFSRPIFGQYQVYNVLSGTTFVIQIGASFTGAFTGGGPLENLQEKQYNFYYAGNKTVEVRYPDGKTSSHSSINGAIIDAAQEGGLVLIHAKPTPYTETIVLKDGVDIYCDPNCILSPTGTDPVITDSGISVNANIFGKANLVTNRLSSQSLGAGSIYITGQESNVYIECQDIIYTHSDNVNGGYNSAVYVSGGDSSKFELHFRHIIAGHSVGVWFAATANKEWKLKGKSIVTGTIGYPTTGSTALVHYGKGIIECDELRCNNGGHTIGMRLGELHAYVKRHYVTCNYVGAAAIHCVSNQSNPNCKLYLYFDEIKVYKGLGDFSAACIEHSIGEFYYNGRLCWTEFGNHAVSIYGINPDNAATGIVEIDTIESNGWSALSLDSVRHVLVKNSKIKASSHPTEEIATILVAYANNGTQAEIKDCVIEQSGVNSHGIKLYRTNCTLTLANTEIHMPPSTPKNSIYSTVAATPVYIRTPIWLSNFAHGNISFINPGITIQ